MGAWGAKLYDDDDALDLRDLLTILVKLPSNGDEILKIVLENYDGVSRLEEDGGGSVFWLVIADQFEKKGIHCSKVFDMAIQIIKNEEDICNFRKRGMDTKDIKVRMKILEKLLFRFENPRLEKNRKKRSSLPAFCIDVGDIYSFPTMKGEGFNGWCSSWEQANFQADGWGALIILSQGRVFDWFPWFSYARLKINHKKEATLENTLKSKLWLKDGCCEVGIPNGNHMKRMKMKLLGNIPLCVEKSSDILPNAFRDSTSAVMCGWTIVHGIASLNKERMKVDVKVSKLLLHCNQQNKFTQYLKNINFFKK